MEASPRAPRQAPSPRRWPWIVASLPVLAGAIWGGLRWAEGPLHRKQELLRVPIRLVEGTTTSGRFGPEHDGPVVVEIRFAGDRDPGIDPQGALRGAGLGRPDGPAVVGLEVSYAVRTAGEVAARGKTDEQAGDWRAVGPELALTVASLRLPAEPSDVEVRVERAPSRLANVKASLVVAPSGDWIHYAWLAAEVRRLAVLGGAAVLVALVLFAPFLLRRRGAGPGPA